MIKTNKPAPAAAPAEQASQASAAEHPEEVASGSEGWMKDLMVGIATQSWLASMAIHMTLFIILALVLGTIHVAATIGAAPVFEVIEEPQSLEPEITHFEVGYTPTDPTELTTETLTMTEAPSVEAQFNDNSPIFTEAGGGIVGGDSNFGGLGGFNVAASGLGPIVKGGGGVDAGAGFGKNMGTGGAGTGFGSRGTGMREAMLGTGGTKQSERAVAAALNWIARHQSPDGKWSLNHTPMCRSGFCSGPGGANSDGAGTGLGLLPFLAAGQTHESKGPYQKNILAGINFLIKNQKKTGDLSVNGSQMYAHGLATIALCEAYGMTQDSRIGYAAQAAIDFIQSGQNRDGAWRYQHGTEQSDTSVYGWQVMALKSGQMAGLNVNPASLQGAKQYLSKVSLGQYKSEFSYTPGGGPTFTMTSVGLLTSQYLGARRDDPVIIGGVEYLSKRKPSVNQRNTYYWYYATQVMHNVPGAQWDDWNRTMRRILIDTQEKSGCQAGSWDPDKPEPDPWGNQGGRLMVTSLSCLTLEVYYRYLPLYKIDDVKKDLNKAQ
ncbi:MAG TPA: prenyltransferase/squalene oxidase repeat-containing protein [Pirellulaceae bacterium]|nr:prenyltransferase/squalene oxidase repeat-containing protein [Pirellulaceae bacterium]